MAKSTKKRVVYIPPPGIDGTYRDSCIGCFNGTDTGLALTGEAEWIAYTLMMLSMTWEEATAIISEDTGNPIGKVPIGEFTMAFAVCQSCADKANAQLAPGVGGLTVGLQVSPEGLPHFRQPPETRRAGL